MVAGSLLSWATLMALVALPVATAREPPCCCRCHCPHDHPCCFNPAAGTLLLAPAALTAKHLSPATACMALPGAVGKVQQAVACPIEPAQHAAVALDAGGIGSGHRQEAAQVADLQHETNETTVNTQHAFYSMVTAVQLTARRIVTGPSPC